jgi:hypothetical protein
MIGGFRISDALDEAGIAIALMIARSRRGE